VLLKPQHPHRLHVGSSPKGSSGGLWITAGIAVLFCSIFAFLVIQHARLTSATYDETAHLPAGYSYLRWNDYRLNPEHPPLVKKLAAWPLLHQNPWPAEIELTQQDLTPHTTTDSLLAMKRSWALALDQSNEQWWFGHYFLYGPRNETLRRFGAATPLTIPTTSLLSENDYLNDADHLLFSGRMMILLMGVLLAILIFLWARDLYGLSGGVLAIALFCFDPNFIAHSGLVTTDVGAALFMFGAVYFLWRTYRQLTVVHAMLMSIFFALAFITKFSAVLLAPTFALLAAWQCFFSKNWAVGHKAQRTLATPLSKSLAVVGLMLAAILATLIAIWAAYDFRYSAAKDPVHAGQVESSIFQDKSGRIDPAGQHQVKAYPDKEPGHFPIEQILRQTAATKVLLKYWPATEESPIMTPDIKEEMDRAPIGLSGRCLRIAGDHHLLPEAYLYGLAQTQMKSLRRGSFLRGEYTSRGFQDYFLWTFLLKTPLVAMFAMAASLFFVIRRKELWRSPTMFILAPVFLYLGVSLSSGLNIGHRHLLPIYPFLFVLCGRLALEWNKLRSTIKPRIACCAVAAIAVSNFIVLAPPWEPAMVYPHYLAYFNELGGGPRNGYKNLVDSNLDWGQDLKALKRWTDKHQLKEPIYLCYFGMADPIYYHIPHYALMVPGGYVFENGVSSLPGAGYLAISATNLQGVYFPPAQRESLRRLVEQPNVTLMDTIGYSIFMYRIGPPTP
jgi:hypothetical protein